MGRMGREQTAGLRDIFHCGGSDSESARLAYIYRRHLTEDESLKWQKKGIT